VALLGSVYFVATQMHFTMFPAIGADVIKAKLQMPAGSSLQHTMQISQKVEKVITKIVGDDLDSLTNVIGREFDPMAKFSIYLVPSGKRKQQVEKLLSYR
jgi:multidrug efflux pump subunit AcrB